MDLVMTLTIYLDYCNALLTLMGFPSQLLHVMGDLRLAPPVDDKVRKVGRRKNLSLVKPQDQPWSHHKINFGLIENVSHHKNISGCEGGEAVLDQAAGICKINLKFNNN